MSQIIRSVSNDIDALMADDDDGQDFDRESGCPMCGESNPPMGNLGRLIWYRCQNCGMDYNREDDGLPAFQDGDR